MTSETEEVKTTEKRILSLGKGVYKKLFISLSLVAVSAVAGYIFYVTQTSQALPGFDTHGNCLACGMG